MVLNDEDGMTEAFCIIIILPAIKRGLINRNPVRRSCGSSLNKTTRKIGRFHALLI